MKDIVYIGIILFLAIFGYLMFKGQQKDCYNRYVRTHREQLLEETEIVRHQKQKELYLQLDSLQREYNTKQQQLKNTIEMADKLMKEQNAKMAYFTAEQNGKRAALERDVEILRQQLTQDLKLEKEKQGKLVEEYRAKAKEKQLEIQKELDDFHKRRVAINEATLRERELKEKEDFYRVCLSNEDVEDIATLNSLRPRLLRHGEIIPKIIWEAILYRPVNEMIKRITNGKKICGIYKVTYTKTGESYIGQTTDIKTRWQNHIKTAIGLEAAASSTFHNRLGKDGIESYTWEILEEVEKDQLREREKYWIELYETHKSGLNMKVG